MESAHFVIPNCASFKNMVVVRGKPTICDDVNKEIIGRLTNADKLYSLPELNDFKKLNSVKDIVDRLTNLIGTIGKTALDFFKGRVDCNDILDDAKLNRSLHFFKERKILTALVQRARRSRPKQGFQVSTDFATATPRQSPEPTANR